MYTVVYIPRHPSSIHTHSKQYHVGHTQAGNTSYPWGGSLIGMVNLGSSALSIMCSVCIYKRKVFSKGTYKVNLYKLHGKIFKYLHKLPLLYRQSWWKCHHGCLSVRRVWIECRMRVLEAGIPSLWGLMPDDLSWNWCNDTRNEVHNTCNMLESSWNHPPPPGPWENCLPRN